MIKIERGEERWAEKGRQKRERRGREKGRRGVSRGKDQIDSLKSVQNLALQVCFRNWDTNYHTLLSTNNIPSLSKTRLFSHLSLLFSIVKGVYSLPHNAPIEIREYHHFSQSQSHPESSICCILLLILLRHSSPLERTSTWHYWLPDVENSRVNLSIHLETWIHLK